VVPTGRLAVVTVLHPQSQLPSGMVLSRRTRRWLWIVAMLDAMAIAWTLSAGEWLDQTSRLTEVATLGGHHQLVLTLAVGGFVMLAGLAVVTDGFTHAGGPQPALITLACMISVVALSGAISVILLLAAAALLLGFVGRLLLRR
jgi:hypothetical protein